MKYAHSGPGIEVADIAELYLDGSLTYDTALDQLVEHGKMSRAQAKEFLRQEVERD